MNCVKLPLIAVDIATGCTFVLIESFVLWCSCFVECRSFWAVVYICILQTYKFCFLLNQNINILFSIDNLSYVPAKLSGKVRVVGGADYFSGGMFP